MLCGVLFCLCSVVLFSVLIRFVVFVLCCCWWRVVFPLWCGCVHGVLCCWCFLSFCVCVDCWVVVMWCDVM